MQASVTIDCDTVKHLNDLIKIALNRFCSKACPWLQTAEAIILLGSAVWRYAAIV